MKITPILMVGGKGTRLWPLSREKYPKQFLSFGENLSMFQKTILRLKSLDFEEPLIICNQDHRLIVAEQLKQIGYSNVNILLESSGRGTAPAIALAAFYLFQKDKSSALFILPADHIIEDVASFCLKTKEAETYIQQDKLVTFGIIPNRAETGYGYIRYGDTYLGNGHIVKSFVEKPDSKTALEYLNSGNYLWNSGIFAFKANVYLKELKKYRLDIYQSSEKAFKSFYQDLNVIKVNDEYFDLCPEESIDYAVMEKTDNAIVIPMDVSWSDVGSWSALWDISDKDENGNVRIGDIITIDSHNNYISSDTSLIATIDINDLVIVQTQDAILVSKKDSVQKVKNVVSILKANNKQEYLTHQDEYQPWGKNHSIVRDENYQIKFLTVNSGEVISLQQNKHSSKHWIIVSGVAKIYIDDKEKIITKNQTINIPIDAIYPLENVGKTNLKLIEIRIGNYLEENDVVRSNNEKGKH
ncbi:mannose-1-phosphate guanylyltransferase/mannose-6-phosphate isomerase [Gallibacterium anatis]|uniref:mannose-1-phosphate guanylyltransferase n=1 Tax=Gallibacterium anatis TaxID=750 RepID=A0A1A7NX93_9PAST|nr:mannose-1-phosphate guanylyltransferase/mannose-6-phosphate isomerase [Gallibacterium anatis]OBW94812.1 mannose-1-phosphate guanyltransferase [Gallibacterium anatis]OBW99448.1 mannose-1-phosphate guanyltransferase [Gallibacterium anatis]